MKLLVSAILLGGDVVVKDGSTEGGDAYTFKELDAMFRDAGFSESTAQELGPETLILTKY